MNVAYAGQVTASLIGPYLYSIWARNLLYVGETQRHPTVRWSQHIGPLGSFRLAATNRALVDLEPDERVAFYAFDLSSALGLFPSVQLKNASQAVEHELHMLIRSQPSFLGIDLQLISDTERTAPRSFRRWDLARSIAEDTAAQLRAAMTTARSLL